MHKKQKKLVPPGRINEYILPRLMKQNGIKVKTNNKSGKLCPTYTGEFHYEQKIYMWRGIGIEKSDQSSKFDHKKTGK